MSNVIIIGDAIIKEAPESIAVLIKELSEQATNTPKKKDSIFSIMDDATNAMQQAGNEIDSENETILKDQIKFLEGEIVRLKEVITELSDENMEIRLDKASEDKDEQIEQLQKQLDELKEELEAEKKARIEVMSGSDSIVLAKEEEIGSLNVEISDLKQQLQRASLLQTTISTLPLEHFMLMQMYRDQITQGTTRANTIGDAGVQFRSGSYFFDDDVLSQLFPDSTETPFVILKDGENVLIYIYQLEKEEETDHKTFNVFISTPRNAKRVIIFTKYDAEEELERRQMEYQSIYPTYNSETDLTIEEHISSQYRKTIGK